MASEIEDDNDNDNEESGLVVDDSRRRVGIVTMATNDRHLIERVMARASLKILGNCSDEAKDRNAVTTYGATVKMMLNHDTQFDPSESSLE